MLKQSLSTSSNFKHRITDVAFKQLSLDEKINLIASCFNNQTSASKLIFENWVPISRKREGYEFYKDMIHMYNRRQSSTISHDVSILQFHINLLAGKYICNGSIASVNYMKSRDVSAHTHQLLP